MPDADVAMRVPSGGTGVGEKTRAVSSASSPIDDALYEGLVSMLSSDNALDVGEGRRNGMWRHCCTQGWRWGELVAS